MTILLILATTLVASASIASSDMAFVFSRSGLCKAELCLHGSFTKGTKITLLSKDSQEVCTGVVGDNFTAEDEMLRFNASTIRDLKGCTKSNYFLAVLKESKVKYKPISGVDLASKELKSADPKVKQSPAFANAFSQDVYDYRKKNKDNSYHIYTMDELNQTKSIGYSFRVSKKELLHIVTHKLGAGSSHGPLFSVFLGTISQVSGTFSFGKPYVFVLNDVVHVLSTHSCQLGCGAVTNEVYKFTGNGFERIYSNSDFST